MVLFVQETIADVPLCGPADSQLLLWRRQPRSHSCSSSYSCLDKVVHMPEVCNDRCPVVRRAENCDVSQLLFSRCGADRGVMPQIMEIVQVFSLLDWAPQVHFLAL